MADYLLEGSVRREGDRVRITARLVESAQRDASLGRDLRAPSDRLPVRCRRMSPHASRSRWPWSWRRMTRRDRRSDGDDVRGGLSGVSEGPLPLEQARRLSQRHCLDRARAGVAAFSQAMRIDPRSRRRTRCSAARPHRARRVLPRAAAACRSRRRARRPSVRSSWSPALRGASGAWRCAPHARVGLARRRARLCAGDRAQSEPGERAPGYAMLLARCAPREAVRESERACELDPLCLVVGINAAWCATWRATTRRRSNAAAARRNWIRNTCRRSG